MTPHEAARLTLSYFHTAGIHTFTAAGPFLYANTAGKYAVDVTDERALDLIAKCYAARQTKPEAE